MLAGVQAEAGVVAGGAVVSVQRCLCGDPVCAPFPSCWRCALANGVLADPRLLRAARETMRETLRDATANTPPPEPTVGSLSARIDALEREVHELRQAQVGARLRRAWGRFWSFYWGSDR